MHLLNGECVGLFFCILQNGYCFCPGYRSIMEIVKEEERGSEKVGEGMAVWETVYPMPICNHTQKVGKENIGYTQGITVDGIPFEADLTFVSDEETLHVILPEIPEFYDAGENGRTCFENVIGYRTTETQTDYGVLKIGMADRQEEFPLV